MVVEIAAVWRVPKARGPGVATCDALCEEWRVACENGPSKETWDVAATKTRAPVPCPQGTAVVRNPIRHSMKSALTPSPHGEEGCPGAARMSVGQLAE